MSARLMHAQLTRSAVDNCSFTYISIRSCNIEPVTCMNEKHEQHKVRCCSTEMAGKDELTTAILEFQTAPPCHTSHMTS